MLSDESMSRLFFQLCCKLENFQYKKLGKVESYLIFHIPDTASYRSQKRCFLCSTDLQTAGAHAQAGRERTRTAGPRGEKLLGRN